MKNEVLADWKTDLETMQKDFLYKKRMYSIIENTLFIWIMLITSMTEVLKFSAEDEIYRQYTSIVAYLIVVSTGVRKYINPEKKVQKFKMAYIESKNLEDSIESQTVSPDTDFGVFINNLRDQKTKILEKYI